MPRHSHRAGPQVDLLDDIGLPLWQSACGSWGDVNLMLGHQASLGPSQQVFNVENHSKPDVRGRGFRKPPGLLPTSTRGLIAQERRSETVSGRSMNRVSSRFQDSERLYTRRETKHPTWKNAQLGMAFHRIRPMSVSISPLLLSNRGDAASTSRAPHSRRSKSS